MINDEFDDVFNLRIINAEFKKHDLFLYLLYEGVGYQCRIELGDTEGVILDQRELFLTPEELLQKARNHGSRQNSGAGVVFVEDTQEFSGSLHDKITVAVKMYILAGQMKDKGISFDDSKI